MPNLASHRSETLCFKRQWQANAQPVDGLAAAGVFRSAAIALPLIRQQRRTCFHLLAHVIGHKCEVKDLLVPDRSTSHKYGRTVPEVVPKIMRQ